jgi:hypothetical protein
MTPGNSTLLEMRFLDGIMYGHWVHRSPAARMLALRNYAEAALRRVWDNGVDAQAVRDYALVLAERMIKEAKHAH